jgi:hypothetical protein
MRIRTARRWGAAGGEAAHNRDKHGTNWGLKGTAAAAWRDKVRNISNFCEKCCGNFFLSRNNFAPKGTDFGEKVEQKRPVAAKNRGIFVTWRVQEFICFYFP